MDRQLEIEQKYTNDLSKRNFSNSSSDNLVLFWAILLKKEVILDFLSFWYIDFSVEKIFKIDGSKVKVIIKETKRPKVIIQPKSIIGFMPLNISDKKAHIVVKTV